MAGAPDAAYVLLARDDDVGAYATWSGSALICVGTGRRRPVIDRALADLLAHAAVPVLVLGPHVRPSERPCSRLVVGLDGARRDDALLSVASLLGSRLGVPLVLTQVVAPTLLLDHDVLESSFLHRAAEWLAEPAATFDTLHATRPADGILRFVSGDPATAIVLGTPVHDHLWRRAGPVVSSVVRRALGPVVLVPVHDPPGGSGRRDAYAQIAATRANPSRTRLRTTW